MQDWVQVGIGRRSMLVYLRQQVVNLDCIAEISVKRGRVTLCYAFARLGEPGARMVLSPADAEPLLSALQQVQQDMPGWVAVEDRLINLDLAADIWSTGQEITIVSALPDQVGGPLPRTVARSAARQLLGYFERAATSAADGTTTSDWVTAGEHLVNLALVSGIRLGANHVQLVFAGLPRFARAFSYDEARPLIERLQQLGALPIDAVLMRDLRPADDEPETGNQTGRRRLGGWLVRRR